MSATPGRMRGRPVEKTYDDLWAEIEILREALDTIHEEASQAEHYGRPVDTGWLIEVAMRAWPHGR